MNKISVALLLSLSLIGLILLNSGAWFSDSGGISMSSFKAAELKLVMELEDVPGQELSGYFSGDDVWIPGDCRDLLLRIKNQGTSDAAWRLGVLAKDADSEIMAHEIILSFYCQDEEGQWKLARSEPLAEYLISANNDNWFYDKNTISSTDPAPVLKPGKSMEMIMQVDFELSALKEVQGEKFEGKIVLQAAQPNDEGWFPAAEYSL